MALRNAFGDLGLDSTLQAIRDRLPVALGGTGGVKVDVGSSALPSGAATSAKQSDGSQKSQVVDGSGNVVGTTANALDVNIKSGTGNTSVNVAQVGGTATDTNSGNKSAGTQRVVLATDQPQLTNALKVDGSATTQPVSGTVTANAGTNLNTSALATSAKQSDGSQKGQVVDGSGNVIGSTANALDVNVKSGGITGFSTSANQTNGTQQTQITDGTNIGSVLKSDSTAAGQNAQITSGTGFTTGTINLSAGTPNTIWYDMLNYSWVSFEILSNASAATLSFQTSGDASQTNTTSSVMTNAGTTGAAGSVNTTSATATFHGPRTGRYFRVSTNLSGGNTASLVLTFFTQTAAYYPGGVVGAKTNNNGTPNSTNLGVLPGIANAAAQSWTEGNQVLESMDLKGNQRTRIQDAAGNDRGANVNASNQLLTTDSASSATGAAVPTNASFAGMSDGTNLNPLRSGIAALNSSGSNVLSTAIAAQFDDVSPTAVNENNWGNVRISANRNLYNTIRDAAGNERGANVNTSNQLSVSVDNSPTFTAAVGSPAFVTTTPSTTGGWTPSLKNGLSNTNSQVKSGAGTLGGWYVYNPNSTATYLQIFDTATGSITVGTTTPKLSLAIPPLTGANIELTNGINFATAICVAATTAATNGTAPGTAIDCNFWYK